MTTEERIIEAAARGLSVRALAAEHGLPEAEVLGTLDRAAVQRFSGESLRRILLLEAERLARLEGHYYSKALDSGEGAMTAGALYCKLSERLTVLLGLNAPVASASITIHQSAPATRISSTEKIRAALDALRLGGPGEGNGEAPASEHEDSSL